jgi:hypothetical protein
MEDEKRILNFSWKTCRAEASWETGIGGRIMLEWTLKKQGVDWIHLAHSRVTWWTLVNAVMNLQVP